MEPSKKRQKHRDDDNFVCPVQDDEGDILFETLREKKERTVRVLFNMEEYLKDTVPLAHKLYREKECQKSFMCLARIAAGLRSFLYKIHLHCPLNVDPSDVHKADVSDIKDLLVMCLSLSVRIRLAAFLSCFHCPKRHDEIYLQLIDYKKSLADLYVTLKERK